MINIITNLVLAIVTASATRQRIAELKSEARRLRTEAAEFMGEARRVRESAFEELRRPAHTGDEAADRLAVYNRLNAAADRLLDKAGWSLYYARMAEGGDANAMPQAEEQLREDVAEVGAALWDAHCAAPGLGLRLSPHGRKVETEIVVKGRSGEIVAGLARELLIAGCVERHGGPAEIEYKAEAYFGSGWGYHRLRRSDGVERVSEPETSSDNGFVSGSKARFDAPAGGVAVEEWDWEPGTSGRVIHVW